MNIDEVQLTKKQINKLGKKIYEQTEKGYYPSVEQLEMLQAVRLQYKEPLKIACDELTKILKKVDNKGIITYRVKRIESIISKIKRNPNMALARMQDIAGVRCILENEKKVYQFHEEIKKSNIFQHVKDSDYIKEPKKNGYKSLHVICKCAEFDIEIQLRNNTQHAWATLVEITDQIFKTKIKEYDDDNNTRLLTLLQIISKSKNLSKEERLQIIQILKKTKFIQKITSTFTKNANILRKHWCNNREGNGNFFLFEVTNKDKPNIYSFNDFTEAEIKYFENFDINNKNEKNMVMAFISSISFDTISKAYSNYILIKHTFYDALISILSNDTGDIKLNSISFSYIKLLHYSRTLVNLSELQIVTKVNNLFSKNVKYIEWKNDIYSEVDRTKNIPIPKYNYKITPNLTIFMYKRKIKFMITCIGIKNFFLTLLFKLFYMVINFLKLLNHR